MKIGYLTSKEMELFMGDLSIIFFRRIALTYQYLVEIRNNIDVMFYILKYFSS